MSLRLRTLKCHRHAYLDYTIEEIFLRFVRDIILINIVAAFVIWLLSHYLSGFRVNHIGDFCFEMVIVLWGIAIVSWKGATFLRRRERVKTLLKERKLPLLEERKPVPEPDSKLIRYSSELKLFVAGLPAALVCLGSLWLR
ncbi:MAG: hypothetical protein CENE_03484 [Candidatus Celerinatantimonas neptuna]|nr:MAG: hypothetical protein CENE_03484 [Candidatus Celerinatantimonas neptuna]